jgi:hypothetical protein
VGNGKNQCGSEQLTIALLGNGLVVVAYTVKRALMCRPK